MSKSLARVTGVILSTEVRAGHSARPDPNNPAMQVMMPWEMKSFKVLVANVGTIDVGYADNYVAACGGEVPTEMQPVDLLVTVSGGKFLNVDAVKPWKDVPLIVAAPAVAAASARS